jgi:methanogen homoisocitrate dehydrogenase
VPARVVVIEGDGTGREVIPAAIEVIRRLGLGLEFHPLNVRAERYLKTAEALPEDDFAQIEADGGLSTREAAAAIAQRLG